MKVSIEKNELVIRLPIHNTPKPSSSGKSLLIAGTGGFSSTSVEHKGKPVKVSVNATIPAN